MQQKHTLYNSFFVCRKVWDTAQVGFEARFLLCPYYDISYAMLCPVVSHFENTTGMRMGNQRSFAIQMAVVLLTTHLGGRLEMIQLIQLAICANNWKRIGTIIPQPKAVCISACGFGLRICTSSLIHTDELCLLVLPTRGLDGAGRARRFSAIIHNDNARRDIYSKMLLEPRFAKCWDLIQLHQESSGGCFR